MAIILSILVGLIHAKDASFYQVDLIVFTHQETPLDIHENIQSFKKSDTIPLLSQSDAKTPYHLMPVTHSQLRQEYWALHRQKDYKVLFHYSWLQPSNNQNTLTLPHISKDGWDVEGTLRIQQNNYYLLNTRLVFTAQNNSHDAFIFAQKQSLKPESVYYLDHPNAGMIIKVHSIT